MLKISDLTVARLRNGDFEIDLPEFYELRSVIENNGWHDNDSTFNHTLTTFEQLEKILAGVNPAVVAYLAQRVGGHTRRELLFLATLFHDIGKKETRISEGDLSRFPGHEKAGALKVRSILQRLGLAAVEQDFVCEIIRRHDEIHQLLADPQDSQLPAKLEAFSKNGLFLELVLLAMADTFGCQLDRKDPENFRFRIATYWKVLEAYTGQG